MDETGTAGFWRERLGGRFDLRGVGHRGFSLAYNQEVYRARVDALDDLCARHDISATGANVLDVGCGTGFFVKYWLDRGAMHVTGVDIAAESIRRLSAAHPECSFRECDIGDRHTDIGGPFDIVGAFDVLYHIVDDECFDQGIANMSTLLKPGGWFLAMAPLTRRVWEAGHVRTRPKRVWLAALSANGLLCNAIDPVVYFLGRQGIPVIGAYVLSPFGGVLNQHDRWLRERRWPNLGNLKLLAAQKQDDPSSRRPQDQVWASEEGQP